MGDGIQRKFALIIKEDRDPRLFYRVNEAIAALRSEGEYEISVMSGREPFYATDHYLKPSSKNLQSLIDGIAERMDDDDLFVFYATGHGCTDPQQGCHPHSVLGKKLDDLNYGNRIIVTSQCEPLLTPYMDSKSTIVTFSLAHEPSWDNNVPTRFWSTNVPDEDGDTLITVRERFSYAVKGQKHISTPLYYNENLPISFSGKMVNRPPFPKEVIKVHTKALLDEQLKRIKPGQLALVMFSFTTCPKCRSYKPTFNNLAQKYNGRFLMMLAEDEDGDEWKGMEGIQGFPTVSFIDYTGRLTPVNKDDPISFMKETLLRSDAERIRHYMELLRGNDKDLRSYAAYNLSFMGKKIFHKIPELIKLAANENYAAVSVINDLKGLPLDHLTRYFASEDPKVSRISATIIGNIIIGRNNDKERPNSKEVNLLLEEVNKCLIPSDPELFKNGLRILGLLREKAESYVPKLLIILKYFNLDPELERLIVKTLGNIGDKKAATAIKKRLGSTDHRLKTTAIYALGRLGQSLIPPKIIPELISMVSNTRDCFGDCAEAAMILAEFNDPRIAPLFIKRMNMGSNAVGVLKAAIKAFEKADYKTAIPILKGLANNGPSSEIRDAAKRALKKIEKD